MLNIDITWTTNSFQQKKNPIRIPTKYSNLKYLNQLEETVELLGKLFSTNSILGQLPSFLPHLLV